MLSKLFSYLPSLPEAPPAAQPAPEDGCGDHDGFAANLAYYCQQPNCNRRDLICDKKGCSYPSIRDPSLRICKMCAVMEKCSLPNTEVDTNTHLGADKIATVETGP